MSKIITKDKERYCIMFKVSIHQENITIINIYTPHLNTFKYNKVNIDKLEGRDKEQYNNNRKLQGATECLSWLSIQLLISGHNFRVV